LCQKSKLNQDLGKINTKAGNLEQKSKINVLDACQAKLGIVIRKLLELE
jgi:hypothetical protein